MDGRETVHIGAADETAALLQRGQALLDLRRYGEAIPLLQRAAVARGTDVRAWCLLSNALRCDGDSQAALDAASQAVALDAGDEWAHRVRGLALSGVGRHVEAVEAGETAVRLAPDEPLTHQMLASVALDGSMMGTARRATAHYVRLAPEQSGAWATLGRLHLREARYEDAERVLRKAMSLDPENAAAMNNLGAAQMRQGRWRDALKSYAQAARLEPGHEVAMGNIAEVMRYVPRSGKQRFKNAWRLAFLPQVAGAIVLAGMVIQLVERGVTWTMLRHQLRRTLPPAAIESLDLRVNAALPLWPPLVVLLGVAAGVVLSELTMATDPGTRQAWLLASSLVGVPLAIANVVMLVRRIGARRRLAVASRR